jgi:hypothetical protein
MSQRKLGGAAPFKEHFAAECLPVWCRQAASAKNYIERYMAKTD